MSFEWLTSKRPGSGGLTGAQRRAQADTAELASRAGLMFRLGFSQEHAVARLVARVAWEFEPSSKHHARPDSLSDASIAKIVADTYARRPTAG